MTEENKEAVGPGSGCPTPGTAFTDGSSPSPAAHIQPDGLPKKKRGRPKKLTPEGTPYKPKAKPKDRPKCEEQIRDYPHFVKVIHTGSHDGAGGIGIYLFKLDETTASVCRYTEEGAGVRWHARKVPNKYGGRPMYIYDRVDISLHDIKHVAQALLDMLPFFGGEKIVEERLEKARGFQKQESVDDKLDKYGGEF